MFNNTTKHQVYFLHIPKTGGTYIKTKNPIFPIKTYGGHCYILNKSTDEPFINKNAYKKYIGNNNKCWDAISQCKVMLLDIAKNFYIFSNVRNIFSWLVSYAEHIGLIKGKNNFIYHYDSIYKEKSFEYLVNIIANREFPYPNRKFITTQLFSSKGNLIVDWINQNHTLDEDLEELSKLKNLNFVKKQKKRVGSHKDYRLYYDDKLIDLVYTTWKREIDLFGFDFEKESNNNQILRKEISKLQKDNIKYVLKTDKFTNTL